MLNRLIDLFIEKTKWVNVITIIISVAGLAALLTTKRDLHPAFKFNYVIVSMSLPNGSVDEVERLITFPLEERLRNVSDLEEMSSTSRAGSASIILKFPQSVKNLSEKIDEARGLVQSEMRLLPSNIRDLEIRRLTEDKIFLADISVIGLNSTQEAHHDFMNSFVSKLKSVKGVSEVDSDFRPLHIFIKFDINKLNRMQISVADIRNAIRLELNQNSIGYNSVSGKSWLLEYTHQPVDVERIKKIQIRNNGFGNKVTIGQFADVRYDQYKSELNQTLINGDISNNILIFKTDKEDSFATFAEIQKITENMNAPEGIRVRILGDAPYFINQQINVLLSNGIGGLILVLIVLGLTMGWRSSMMTAIGLPISYFGTFIVLKLMGISIDLISLIAMILVVGNLVDDAVIFSERYNQLLAEGFNPKDAASTTAKELIRPVSGTILTIIFAFVPIIVLDSELSVVFIAIPVVISTSLMLSWFETFFILPNHMQHYVKKSSAERATEIFFWLSSKYKILLRHTIKFRYLYGMVSIGLLVYSLITATKMPQNFNLNISPPQVELFINFNNEMQTDQIISVLKPLHEKIKALPVDQLDFVQTTLGRYYENGTMYRGPKYARIRLILNKYEADTKTLRATVKNEVEEILKNFSSPEIERISVAANERNSGQRRTNLSTIRISGVDDEKLNMARSEVLKLVSDKSKNLEFVIPETDGPETFKFNLNLNKLADLGINRDHLSTQIQSLTGITEIAEARSRGRWMNIYLEPETYQLPTAQDLAQLKVNPFPDGQKINLSQLGDWKSHGHSETIQHRNGIRNISLDFKYDGTKTNEQVVKKELEELIKPLISLYSGLEIKVVDANEQDSKGRGWGLKVILLAFVCIYLILAFTLGSFSQPIIVGLPIPFALIGVIWALKLHGMELSLMVMIGLIGTMGVSVNDSIVMVHQVNLLWKKYGTESAELLIDAASSRLRAIILTASCTLIGVFPTAYGIGGESGFTQPMAFSMGWGLTTSLMLTLFIIPSMLMVLKDVKSLYFKIQNKYKKKPLIKIQETQIDLQN